VDLGFGQITTKKEEEVPVWRGEKVLADCYGDDHPQPPKGST